MVKSGYRGIECGAELGKQKLGVDGVESSCNWRPLALATDVELRGFKRLLCGLANCQRFIHLSDRLLPLLAAHFHIAIEGWGLSIFLVFCWTPPWRLCKPLSIFKIPPTRSETKRQRLLHFHSSIYHPTGSSDCPVRLPIYLQSNCELWMVFFWLRECINIVFIIFCITSLVLL